MRAPFFRLVSKLPAYLAYDSSFLGHRSEFHEKMYNKLRIAMGWVICVGSDENRPLLNLICAL